MRHVVPGEPSVGNELGEYPMMIFGVPLPRSTRNRMHEAGHRPRRGMEQTIFRTTNRMRATERR